MCKVSILQINISVNDACSPFLGFFSWRGRVLIWSHSSFVCGFHAVTITPPKMEREGKRSLKLEPFLSRWERNHSRLDLIKVQHFLSCFQSSRNECGWSKNKPCTAFSGLVCFHPVCLYRTKCLLFCFSASI